MKWANHILLPVVKKKGVKYEFEMQHKKIPRLQSWGSRGGRGATDSKIAVFEILPFNSPNSSIIRQLRLLAVGKIWGASWGTFGQQTTDTRFTWRVNRRHKIWGAPWGRFDKHTDDARCTCRVSRRHKIWWAPWGRSDKHTDDARCTFKRTAETRIRSWF